MPHPLRAGVREAYSRAAERPADPLPFPIGRAFAEAVGYPASLLDEFPGSAAEAFTGVSNLSITAGIPPGATVLDLGCGAGLDSFIAARRAGETGRVVGVDFSLAMLRRARSGAALLGGSHLLFCQADAERLPLAAAAVDVALVNGIFNLNPDREAIFRELARVVRPGGVAHAAELILREPLSATPDLSEASWFA